MQILHKSLAWLRDTLILMIIFEKIFIVVLATIGFILASYIRSHKKTERPLVCPLEGSCETVVHSEYSSLFGIPLELLGMVYYGLIAISYAFIILFGYLVPGYTSTALMILSLIAFIFSLYLTAVQAFIIHHWCTWCLFSASISTLICILSLFIFIESTFGQLPF